MKKIVRLTESDLIRLVKRVIKEQDGASQNFDKTYFEKNPKGTMFIGSMRDVEKVNGVEVDGVPYLKPGDNMGRGFQAGEYKYEYVPNYQTMRKPSGEPVLSFDDDRFTMFFA